MVRSHLQNRSGFRRLWNAVRESASVIACGRAFPCLGAELEKAGKTKVSEVFLRRGQAKTALSLGDLVWFCSSGLQAADQQTFFTVGQRLVMVQTVVIKAALEPASCLVEAELSQGR